MKFRMFKKARGKFDNKISTLDFDVSQIEVRLEALETKVDSLPKCFVEGDEIEDKYIISTFIQYLMAIKEYLGLEIKEEWVDDKSFPPRPVPKKRVFKARKVK